MSGRENGSLILNGALFNDFSLLITALRDLPTGLATSALEEIPVYERASIHLVTRSLSPERDANIKFRSSMKAH